MKLLNNDFEQAKIEKFANLQVVFETILNGQYPIKGQELT